MSLESKAGGTYMQELPVPATDNQATSLEMNDVSTEPDTSKRKKKVIYFADGSTMEDYDDDEDDATDKPENNVEPMARCTVAGSTESAPPPDPSKLTWPEYVRHVSSKAGSKTLSVLEGMGGTAAYYLGITTPKYQSEIDEYNRMMAKKKSQEEELVSWSTGPKSQQSEPVIEDIKTNETIEEKPVLEK